MDFTAMEAAIKAAKKAQKKANALKEKWEAAQKEADELSAKIEGK